MFNNLEDKILRGKWTVGKRRGVVEMREKRHENRTKEVGQNTRMDT